MLLSRVPAEPYEKRRGMGKQSQNKFRKRQKEAERMRKAREKMARRQAKKKGATETDTTEMPDQA